MLQIQLEAVAKMVSRRAGELSQERGYKTVRKKDIKDAYEEFLKPQSVLMEASDDLGKWQDKMVKHAENTPLYLPEDE
nr:hypothetical protein DEQ67_16630 [Haloferax sp. Atlit-48N]